MNKIDELLDASHRRGLAFDAKIEAMAKKSRKRLIAVVVVYFLCMSVVGAGFAFVATHFVAKFW